MAHFKLSSDNVFWNVTCVDFKRKFIKILTNQWVTTNCLRLHGPFVWWRQVSLEHCTFSPSREGFWGCSEQVLLETPEAPPHSTAFRKVAGNVSVPEKVRGLEAVTCADACAWMVAPLGSGNGSSCWTGVSWSVFIRCWPSSRRPEKCAVIVSSALTSASGRFPTFLTHIRLLGFLFCPCPPAASSSYMAHASQTCSPSW